MILILCHLSNATVWCCHVILIIAALPIAFAPSLHNVAKAGGGDISFLLSVASICRWRTVVDRKCKSERMERERSLLVTSLHSVIFFSARPREMAVPIGSLSTDLYTNAPRQVDGKSKGKAFERGRGVERGKTA